MKQHVFIHCRQHVTLFCGALKLRLFDPWECPGRCAKTTEAQRYGHVVVQEEVVGVVFMDAAAPRAL